MFTVGDLVGMCPFPDYLLAYSCSSKRLIAAMEAGFGLYPRETGAFPAICEGMHVEFSPSKPSGERVTAFTINGVDLMKEERDWVFVTKTYLAAGKDGYDCLEGMKEIMDKDCCILISSLIRSTISKQQTLRKLLPITQRAFRKEKIRPKMDDRIVNVERTKESE